MKIKLTIDWDADISVLECILDGMPSVKDYEINETYEGE